MLQIAYLNSFLESHEEWTLLLKNNMCVTSFVQADYEVIRYSWLPRRYLLHFGKIATHPVCVKISFQVDTGGIGKKLKVDLMLIMSPRTKHQLTLLQQQNKHQLTLLQQQNKDQLTLLQQQNKD